eukprot:m.136690 g.136690  ORF g.136690 m.136690 type:complete len:567 (+) comp17580_c0_seq2:227-1927(+)
MGGRGSKDSGTPSQSVRTPPPHAAPPRRTSTHSTSGGAPTSPGSFSMRSNPMDGNAATLNAGTVSQWFSQLDISSKIIAAKQMTDASPLLESQAIIALGAASYLTTSTQGAADAQRIVDNITNSASPMSTALSSLAFVGHGDTNCAQVIANLLPTLPIDPSTREVRKILVACIAVHPAFDATMVKGVKQSLLKDMGAAPVPQRPELKIQELFVESAIATDVVTDPRSKRAGCAFRVRTVWSDGREEEAFRAHKDMFSFQCALLDLFPDDAILGESRQIPFLPGKKMISMRKSPQRLAESRKPQIQTYLTSLLALSPRMSRCAHTVDFFKSCPTCRFPLAGCAAGCTVGVTATPMSSPGGAIAEADEGGQLDGQVHVGRLSPTYTTGNPAFVQPKHAGATGGDNGDNSVQKATSITAMMSVDPNGIPEGEEVSNIATGNDIPSPTGGDGSEEPVPYTGLHVARVCLSITMNIDILLHSRSTIATVVWKGEVVGLEIFGLCCPCRVRGVVCMSCWMQWLSVSLTTLLCIGSARHARAPVEMRNRIGTLDDVRNSLFEPSGTPIPAPRS